MIDRLEEARVFGILARDVIAALPKHITVADLRGPSRRLEVTRWRAHAIRAAKAGGMSTSAIGRVLQRDHSSIRYHLAKKHPNRDGRTGR